MMDVRAYFRLNNINIRSDAIQYLSTIANEKSAQQRKAFLDQILRFLQAQPETSLIVSKDEIEVAVKDFTLQDNSSGTDFFWVIDAFSVPRVVYDVDKKLFSHASALGIPQPPLHAHAEWKALCYVERYEMLFNRAMRCRLFVRSSLDRSVNRGKNNGNTFTLFVIEELLSQSVAVHKVCVLGMITSLQEGKFHLEDPTGVVELDVTTTTQFHSGLYTHNVFVIVEGWYEDNVFHAAGIGMPPPEDRAASRSLFGDFNFFGGPSQVSFKASSKLAQIEKKNADAVFVILSDVWLDRPEVLAKLDTLFGGFSTMPPFAFILCGNFLAEAEKPGHDRQNGYQNGFRALATLLQKYPAVRDTSRFVFVPGPMDAGVSGILPRPRIPKHYTAEFERIVKNAIFTSNPCRLQYCTQEIVVIREDILSKVCRTLIRDPQYANKDDRFRELTKQLAKTITSQAHLCPLEAHILPVYWSYDHALRLYALPDLVIVADIQEPFMEKTDKCLVANPSSFPRHKFQFLVYMPASNSLELSQITD